MKRRDFIKNSLFGICTAAGFAYNPSHSSSAPKSSDQPNIVIIVADDAGWSDFGFHGSEIQTPNIDRLAREGLELEHFYVDPVCSPTRASLMTGRPPSRIGITGPLQVWDDHALPDDTITIAEMLRRAGYDTCITGKWHLGMRPHQYPGHFGFRHSYGYVGPWIDSYTHFTTNFHGDGEIIRQWHRNGELISEFGEHVTDLITREAVRFITGLRHRDRPFFLYVPYSAPHTPIQEDNRWTDLYADSIENSSRRYFAAAMTHMDDGIGTILTTLEKQGLRDNTLVLFFSDNGGSSGGNFQERWLMPPRAFYMSYGPTDVLSDNSPLRGWKGSLYEGGIRVTALANWPGKISSGKAGAALSVRDIYPTLAHVAGTDIPDGVTVEGDNIWPALTGGEISSGRIMYWRRDPLFAVRKGGWKLIHKGKTLEEGTDELFNIAEDPYETSDMAGSDQRKLRELKEELARQAAMDKT